VSEEQSSRAGESREALAALWARVHREAAHAVVGTLLGGRVTEVEVWPGPPVGGRAAVEGLDGGSDGYVQVRRIIYLLAGPVSERIARGGSGLIMNDPAAFVSSTLAAAIDLKTRPESAPDPSAELLPELADIAAAADLILDHFGADDEVGIAAAVDHLGLNVESFVRGQWNAVELVALALLRNGRLTEDDLKSLMARALPEGPPAELLRLLPSRDDAE
jgi:hypothetical protein